MRVIERAGPYRPDAMPTKDVRLVTQFRVPDIHCASCIRSLTSAVRDLDGKATLRADLATKLVEVDTTARDEAVAEAMRGAGFIVEAV
jgi:copper chaperone